MNDEILFKDCRILCIYFYLICIPGLIEQIIDAC